MVTSGTNNPATDASASSLVAASSGADSPASPSSSTPITSIDLAIIGGGPAALSAALYAARAGLNVKVFEKADFGGILPTIPSLENYPGFNGAGKLLAEQMRVQAARAGARLEYGECTNLAQSSPDAVALPSDDQSASSLLPPSSTTARMYQSTSNTPADQGTPCFLLTIDGEPVSARSVIIASGSEPKKLPFDLAIPVSYCALCDGALVRDKRVVVVGGANSAVQEALYLANIAKSVTIISHSPLKADQELLSRLPLPINPEQKSQAGSVTNSERTPQAENHQASISPSPQLQNLEIIENVEPTADFLNQFDYCFVYIGKTPATSYLNQLAQKYALLSHDGYVLADQNNAKYPHQTVIDGLFVAGDIRFGATRQVITAAADGAEAAIEVANWLKNTI